MFRIMALTFVTIVFFCSLPCIVAPAGNRPPEPLSGLETSKIVKEIYDSLGPRLGSYFVESNVVLTIAGARGHTEFYIDYPRPDDDEKLRSLNGMLEPRGLKISRGTAIHDGTLLMVGIESLKGYERVSKLTAFSFYRPFDASQGWDGLDEWSVELNKRARQEGISDDDLLNITCGVRYGYPDIAIRDFLSWLASSKELKYVTSSIPFAGRYKCAEPNFIFLPEHRNNAAIKSTVDLCGTILRDFYDSPWHREREKDPVFLAARAENDANREKSLKERVRKASSSVSAESSDRTGPKAARFYCLRLPPGADLFREIEKYARESNISSGFVATCCGSLTDVSIRFAGEGKATALSGKFEIVSLTGTVSSAAGSHLHISISDRTGKTVGGHLMEGSRIYTTAEIVIGSVEGVDFIRALDERSGYKELRFVEK